MYCTSFVCLYGSSNQKCEQVHNDDDECVVSAAYDDMIV